MRRCVRATDSPYVYISIHTYIHIYIYIYIYIINIYTYITIYIYALYTLRPSPARTKGEELLAALSKARADAQVRDNFKLPPFLKLTNTHPFAAWFEVTGDASPDGTRVVRSVLGAISSLPIVDFRGLWNVGKASEHPPSLAVPLDPS